VTYAVSTTETKISIPESRDSTMDEARTPIRITPAFFFLMLTLTEGSRHGHVMAREVEERSGGSVKLGPGSLYWSLGRLADVGLIEEVDPPDGETDERRRYYQLTARGRAILAREAATLEKIVEYARLRRIV
jgi:DNA-binding PadR family transcriptional regulator